MSNLRHVDYEEAHTSLGFSGYQHFATLVQLLSIFPSPFLSLVEELQSSSQTLFLWESDTYLIHKDVHISYRSVVLLLQN